MASQTYEFYAARAAKAASDAEAATLSNVRDHALRSEAACQRALADKTRAVAEQRRKIAATKAAEAEAEASA